MIFGLSKSEIRFIVVVLAVLWSLTAVNLLESQILARDIQRKNDLKHIATALENYRKNEAGYPIELEGKMFTCLNEDKSLRVCNWGSDPLESTSSAYINPMPEDPLEHKNEASYLYLSDTRNYQLFAALEKLNDDEFNQKVADRKLPCGNKICNFAVTSGIPVEEDLTQHPTTQ